MIPYELELIMESPSETAYVFLSTEDCGFGRVIRMSRDGFSIRTTDLSGDLETDDWTKTQLMYEYHKHFATGFKGIRRKTVDYEFRVH